MTLISCVIPMYNSSKTILRALESIKNQTYQGKFQIIVVDDGSNDESVFLVEKFKKDNLNLWIDLIKKENGGVSSTRNLGMKYAQGEYIAFLDSDDHWLKEKIELQFNVMISQQNIHLLGCTGDGVVPKRVLGSKADELIPLEPFGYALKSQLITSSVLFKREVYERIGGFDESMKYAEDMNYWLRSMEYFKCYLLNKPLVVMEYNNDMKHSGGLSSKLWDMEKGELKNIREIYNKEQINFCEYIFASVFSFFKFIRRSLFSKYI